MCALLLRGIVFLKLHVTLKGFHRKTLCNRLYFNRSPVSFAFEPSFRRRIGNVQVCASFEVRWTVIKDDNDDVDDDDYYY